MPRARRRQALLSISAILQGLRLYPAEHPQIDRQLDNAVQLLTPLTRDSGQLTIGLLDGTLLLNDIPCLESQAGLEELARLLERQRLQAIELLPGIDRSQLLFLCRELPQLDGGSLSSRLELAGISAVRARPLDEKQNDPRTTYRQALETVTELFRDVRLGQIPSSEKARGTVDSLLSTTLAEPAAMFAMTLLKDYDNYTFTHSVNVSVLAISVGCACGLAKEQLASIGLGGLLHDLGKMTIDHRILAKPGKLSDEEFRTMQLHPVNGARIVADMEQMDHEVIDIVNHHHLQYDRSGYPADSRGRAVTPLTDMVCIADTYDALTTLRCYQRPRSPRQAIDRMRELSGKQLHPQYLEHFLDSLGPYPVGTLVRLCDRRIGLVCDQSRQQRGLTLKIIFDRSGQRLSDPPLQQLADESSIVAEVDPLLKQVRLEDYLPD